jgi:hypothetical protein
VKQAVWGCWAARAEKKEKGRGKRGFGKFSFVFFNFCFKPFQTLNSNIFFF